MTDRQRRLFKQAYTPFTPQAMAAHPPPGAPPMDPSMQGAPMPPMDPSMQGAPMPPMDPSMQGAPMPPMDPSMQGAPGGMPPTSGDPVIDLLMQMGVMFVDGQSGQPIPPEAIMGIAGEIRAQMGGIPQGAAPMEQPPQEDLMVTLAQLDKSISVLTDKVDTIRNIIDDDRVDKIQKSDKSAEDDVNQMDAEVRAMLQEQAMQSAPVEAVPAAPMDVSPQALAQDQVSQLQLLQAMQGGGL